MRTASRRPPPHVLDPTWARRANFDVHLPGRKNGGSVIRKQSTRSSDRFRGLVPTSLRETIMSWALQGGDAHPLGSSEMTASTLIRRHHLSSDAIVILKQDHKEISKAFRDFQRARDNATTRKGQVVDRIIELLAVHTYIENEVMYPRVRELLPKLEDDVLEPYEEHHVANVLVVDLTAMKPADERFDAETTVLIESVTHHIKEEEDDWFPQVRAGLSRTVLREIGEEMERAREKAPTRPSQPSALKKTVDAIIT